MTQITHWRSFGVPSHLKTRIMIYHRVYLGDALTVLIFGGAILRSASLHCFVGDSTHWPFAIFAIDMALLCCYLLLHPRSNPGKANWELLYLTFIHTTRFFQSINTFYDYTPVKCPFVDKYMPKSLNHRLPVDRKYLYHSDDDDSVKYDTEAR